MFNLWLPLVTCLCLVALPACSPGTPEVPQAAVTATSANAQDGGALTDASMTDAAQAAEAAEAEAAAEAQQAPAPALAVQEIDWRPMPLDGGEAWIGCKADYTQEGDGIKLEGLGFSGIWHAVAACRQDGMMRVRYRGKVDAGFTAMVERVAEVADGLGIRKRIMDMDSPGGLVEEGIRAGDKMAESNWTVWVREGASCHSACVLIIAAGDMRMIAGNVGVHRIMRIGSRATSRAELNQELREVYERMREFLERNGATVAVADLMMTVPNRSLRLLTAGELGQFGLDGANAAEDDLDRIRLARKCGESFVERRDGFFRAFDRQCNGTDEQVVDMNACGLALKKRFGFPDATCPTDSPLGDYN